jgi:hypothetical protein
VLRKGLHKVRFYGLSACGVGAGASTPRKPAWRAHLARRADDDLLGPELYQQMLIKHERSIVFYRALA